MRKKIIIGSLIALATIIMVFYNDKTNAVNVISNNEQPEYFLTNQIVVEIKGEVNRPGVYVINNDERLYTLIKVAGGLTEFAEEGQVNFAQKLVDGMVISIPRKSKENDLENTQNDSNKISINKATISDLTKLKGIGESRARNIIDYRKTHGPFISIEGLLNVPGISETIFNQIKDDITV